MPSLRRVALLVRLNTSFGRRVLQGVVDYCWHGGLAGRNRWELLSDSWGDIGLAEMGPGGVDAIIAAVTDARMLEAVRATGLPVVNVAHTEPGLQLPSVIGDSAQAGRLAQQYFLDRRLGSLALLGQRDSIASQEMERAYRPKFQHGTPLTWAGQHALEREALDGWLGSLPRPCGLFAVNDILARRVLQSARQLGIVVPEELAVLGAGDYELVNILAVPPLSSVIQSARRIGFRAAELLHAWLEGQAPPQEPIRIAPAGIVSRRSTDILAIQDSTVAAAVRFIHEQVERGVRVDEVAEHVSVSRRWLEQQFEIHLGRSPGVEIRRAQVEQARRLLVETDWPLSAVARACGLKAPERLSVLFKREVGISPSLFREQFHS